MLKFRTLVLSFLFLSLFLYLRTKIINDYFTIVCNIEGRVFKTESFVVTDKTEDDKFLLYFLSIYFF